MNDLIGRQGTIMVMKSDGTSTPLGEVTEIYTTTESPTSISEPLSFQITDDTEFTMTTPLTKKNKKVWGKLVNMPKYKLTEWIFPRKKKRGTKRRLRKAYNMLSEYYHQKELT